MFFDVYIRFFSPFGRRKVHFGQKSTELESGQKSTEASLRAAPYHVNEGRDCETMPNSVLRAFPAFGENNLCKKINTLNMQGREYVNSIWRIARNALYLTKTSFQKQ